MLYASIRGQMVPYLDIVSWDLVPTVEQKGADSRDLIVTHQATVALDIGTKDRGELPFDAVGFLF